MAYHSFLVEPISCHAWNKDRTRECRCHRMGGGAGAPGVHAGGKPARRPGPWALGLAVPLLHLWSPVWKRGWTSSGHTQGQPARGPCCRCRWGGKHAGGGKSLEAEALV